MDNARFKAHIYFVEKLKKIDNSFQYIKSDDGTLYSGAYKTKITPDDLPEWYVRGVFYKRRGFMSAKGITDMVYCPSRLSDNFLNEDSLLVSYSGKIKKNRKGATVEDSYTNYDEVISGVVIIKIIAAAREHSDYDISSLMQELQSQRNWLKMMFPSRALKERWDIPIEDLFMNWC